MTKENNQPKAIVKIAGGCVQEVIHNIEGLEVIVLDADITQDDKDEGWTREFEGKEYYNYQGEVSAYYPERVNNIKDKTCT